MVVVRKKKIPPPMSTPVEYSPWGGGTGISAPIPYSSTYGGLPQTGQSSGVNMGAVGNTGKKPQSQSNYQAPAASARAGNEPLTAPTFPKPSSGAILGGGLSGPTSLQSSGPALSDPPSYAQYQGQEAPRFQTGGIPVRKKSYSEKPGMVIGLPMQSAPPPQHQSQAQHIQQAAQSAYMGNVVDRNANLSGQQPQQQRPSSHRFGGPPQQVQVHGYDFEPQQSQYYYGAGQQQYPHLAGHQSPLPQQPQFSNYPQPSQAQQYHPYGPRTGAQLDGMGNASNFSNRNALPKR
jgi:hypothetical protein